ncbi:MAG: hypothetical protein ACKV19_01050 [Verrucomicrobiales bacterium]
MPESFASVSLPVLAAAFVAGMAVLAVVRGVLRLILGMVKLAIGFAVGTYVFLKAPDWLASTLPNTSAAVLGGLSVVAGALGHLGSGAVLGKLVGGGDVAAAAGQGMGKGKAALISLLPSGALLWMGAIVLRLAGSLNGMAYLDLGPEATLRPWLAEARHYLSQGAVGKFLNAVDPVTSPEVVRLCEILVTYRDPARWKSVKADPALRTVLNHPAFRRLLDDREVKHAVAHSNHARLFTLPEVRAAAQDPELARALRAMRPPEVRRAERIEE